MKDYMPTEGIWLVTKKGYGSKSSSRVMKVSDLPEKWPLLHYYEYKEEILNELVDYVEQPRSLNDVVQFILEFISKKYIEDAEKRNSKYSDKLVEKIIDLYND